MIVNFSHKYVHIGTYELDEFTNESLGIFIKSILKSNRDSYHNRNKLEIEEVEPEKSA